MDPIWIALCSLAFTGSVALFASAFFMGRLFQRVVGLESTLRKEAGTHDDVILVKEQMRVATISLKELQSGMVSVQRQIATLMGRKDGRIIELPETGL